MNSRGRAGVVATALLTASCAGPLMKLPEGPGEPATDAAAAMAAATSSCRAVSSMVAEVSVRGSLGGRRVRGRLHLGLAPPASARLEAVAPFGQPLFVFVAFNGRSTLLLTRENRVLEHDAPESVLEAIAGVPLDPLALRTALTGCVVAPAIERATRLGEDWRVVPDGARLVYLRRQGRQGPWRLVAAVYRESRRPEWRAAYDEFQGGLARRIHLASSDRNRFDLRLDLSQVDLNVALGADAFQVRIPPTAEPISLDELRRSGPLAE